MIRRGVAVQLVVFGVISIAAIAVLLFRFAGLSTLISPPYLVQAHFTDAGGIFPRAEIDLLGTAVGTVEDVAVDASGGVVASLLINNGVSVPVDVTATVTNKSALGEQYIELVPRSSGGPLLAEGSVIPVDRTRTPPLVRDLLANLNSLAASVPKQALATNLVELSAAFGGTGPDLQRLLDQSDTLTSTNLANLHDLIGLIDSSGTVLDTQAARGDQIRDLGRNLAGLTDQVRESDPVLAELFGHGRGATDQVTGLVRDNKEVLPGLFTDLLAVTDVAHARQPQIRKSLVVLPWALERAAGAIRYCDENDPKTGEPIPSTCHYDAEGRPDLAARFAFQLPEKPLVSAPYNVCVRGYQDTKKYLPSGLPADGHGPVERPDQRPNNNARCAALPTDPGTPNIRGAQNAQHPR
ncbi:MCE family protein [Pseudonocardia spinosispora]|uniref:MCE family protein n=1 Tax=Pseudonocardia spinosispora TaxID=103441 RepID=UPI00040F9BB7|nr:MlaD family protein [Pseudonocardia spinosispora]